MGCDVTALLSQTYFVWKGAGLCRLVQFAGRPLLPQSRTARTMAKANIRVGRRFDTSHCLALQAHN